MESKWIKERDVLEKLINEEQKSYEEIGRIYGCSGNNIKKVAIRLGIELKPRRVINECEHFNRKNTTYICKNCGKEFKKYSGHSGKFCSFECSCEYKHKQKYQDFLNNPEKYCRGNYQPSPFKEDILKEQGNKCAICGNPPEHNGRPLVFILDHIDGHASHNYRENLRMICPNCDSQLPTYKSKNKNGDRHYYRYHKEKRLKFEIYGWVACSS